jgi:thiamine biosynthesis lipoprotein
MGTLLAVTFPAARAEMDMIAVRTVFETASLYDGVMSRHQPDSDLRRLNRRAGDPSGVTSAALAEVLAEARALAEQTDGAFDPTVAPLAALWQRALRRKATPTCRDVSAVLGRVGWPALTVAGARAALDRAGMAVDLGGFGKGVALDRIGAALRRQACTSAFVNFGESSLLAIGRPPRGRWTIALRHPLGGFAAGFPLRDRACSTSATVKPAHPAERRARPIVDPRTGHLVETIAQVTVLARSAAVAEAASTAMLVQGRSAMEELAERLDVDACWIDAAGIVTTPWFPLQRLA